MGRRRLLRPRWIWRRAAILLPIALLAWLVALAAGEHATYHDRIAATYDFKFGKNPFLPSQATTESGEFLDPSAFPKAEYCAKCHQAAHAEWRQTAHANAFREPFYQKNVDLLIQSKGIEFTRHCEGCHNPLSLFSGALTKVSKVDRWFDQEGVTCMTCHSITKIASTSGTGSYVMGEPAVMVNPDGTPVRGAVSDEEIMRRPDLHARAVMRDFYRTSEYCAVCHKSAMPAMMNDYKWQRMFSPYDEWQQSSWSALSPLPFYSKSAMVTCQNCHMPRIAVDGEPASKQGPIASHRWLGANTAIPFFYGYDEQLQKTMAFLQAQLLGIDIFALSKGGGRDGEAQEVIAPLDRRDFMLRSGETITLSAVIQNKRIGHSLVPELRDFYECWVECRVTDQTGRLIFNSGHLLPDGRLEESAHSYTSRLISEDSKLLDLHQVWKIRTKAYDNTILPGQSDLVRYQFRIPRDAQGPLRIAINVRYRRFRRDFSNWALGKDADYPVARMASREIQLQLGANKAAAPIAGEDDALRWNNYGIALLAQRQYSKAIRAFDEGVNLKPDQADGYINLAITNYSYEKFDAARELIDRALAIDPRNMRGNMRAKYYQALLLRTQGKLDEAAKVFAEVIGAYPRFRDARLELGLTYYQQRQFEQARVQFEALQAIDPDDLSAHYNLMLIYRRLGLAEQAQAQMAYFVDRKDDPGAASFAHEYLRAHREVSSESVPWHVHVGTPPSETIGAAKGKNQK